MWGLYLYIHITFILLFPTWLLCGFWLKEFSELFLRPIIDRSSVWAAIPLIFYTPLRTLYSSLFICYFFNIKSHFLWIAVTLLPTTGLIEAGWIINRLALHCDIILVLWRWWGEVLSDVAYSWSEYRQKTAKLHFVCFCKILCNCFMQNDTNALLIAEF